MCPYRLVLRRGGAVALGRISVILKNGAAVVVVEPAEETHVFVDRRTGKNGDLATPVPAGRKASAGINPFEDYGVTLWVGKR